MTPEAQNSRDEKDVNRETVEAANNVSGTSSTGAGYDEDLERGMRGWPFVGVIIALCLATYCVALDNTIISTAIPSITDHFMHLEDVGWYGSAYLFTTCALQLLFGKFYSMYKHKYIFIASLTIFEVGSLVCAVSPTSNAFIAGRALAGVGGAGVLSGSLIIVATLVPLAKRATFTSILGGMFGIAGVSGPLIGGALTAKASWRWCFYINLPIGAVTFIILLLWLKPQKIKRTNAPTSLRLRILELDPIGNTFFIASIICLLLTLQLAGTTYAWSNGRIIGLLVVFAVLLAAFVFLQWKMPDHEATVPTGIMLQRSIAFGSIFAFCIGATFFVFVFFLPYYLQAVKGDSALRSGVDLLPLILTQVAGTIIAGVLTSKVGYYMPFVLLSVVFMSVGAGLLTTLTVTSSTGHWAGYQIIFGLGAGFGFQQATIAAQAVLPRDKVATGTSIALFIQLLGGAVFVSAGNNIFTTKLVEHVIAADIQGVDPSQIVSAGATQIRTLVSAAQVPAVLQAYMAALTDVYRLGLIMASLSFLGAIGMEWVDVRKMGDLALGMG